MKTKRNAARRSLFLLLLPLIASATIFCLFGTAVAQPEQDEEAAAKTGIEFQPRLGEYHYEITWGPSRVGQGVIVIERAGYSYLLKAENKTTGLVDKIYRLRYTGEARIKTEDLSPVDSTIVDENRNRKKVQISKYKTSEENNTVKVIETRSRNNQQEAETKEYEYESDSGVVDIFSAIFLARSFDWQIGERHGFIVFVGPKQYEVTMDCIGTTTFSIGDAELPVWVIRPTSKKIGGEGSSFTHEKTLVYLSADESKDVIRVKSKIGIGSVKLTVVKYIQK